MPLSDKFLDQCTMSFLVKKNITSADLHQSRLVPKNHKKLNKNYCKIFVWCKVAKIGENGFFSQSKNYFLNIPADILVSFSVILLFWSLSLSPVWLNIKGWQDFMYKTPIIFFYSENNSDSLNRPPNTNLPIVHCFSRIFPTRRTDYVVKWHKNGTFESSLSNTVI